MSHARSIFTLSAIAGSALACTAVLGVTDVPEPVAAPGDAAVEATTTTPVDSAAAPADTGAVVGQDEDRLAAAAYGNADCARYAAAVEEFIAARRPLLVAPS